jgi:two-component system cell cycle response regulator DivK
MTGASILVVDDSPVNLKLMRLLLTYEGFEVRTSGRAEEALQMLDNFRPALVLTDIQMPGMDGLEMTRRIKGDCRTSGIKVAALTASTSRFDNARAIEAGCEGYITKPVDTATLAARVRDLLGEKTAAPLTIEVTPPAPRVPAPDMGALRRRFLREGSDRSRAFLESLDIRLDSVRMSGQLHEWAGSGGTLGFPTITKLARYGEELLAESPLRPGALREALSDLYMTFDELIESEDTPEPDHVLRALQGKRIALVGLPAERSDAICAALGRVEARPLLFSVTDELESQSIRECDLTILHVQPGIDAERLSAAAAGAGTGRLLLAGERADLMNLAPGMQSAAAEYLAGTWEPEEVLMRLALASLRTSTAAAPPKPVVPQAPRAEPRNGVASPSVLLADDDPIILALLRSILRNYGMQCQTADNGQEALRVIRETQPQVAVLDVNMPQADGYEVLTAIRAENLPTMVVMLSARQQEPDILRGFQLGADDYLIKPFNPLELVARVKRLLRQGARA